MLDYLLESYRRSWEASIKMQQQMFGQWLKQWHWSAPSMIEASARWSEASQRRWLESFAAAMSKQRELVESVYRAGVRVMQQSMFITDSTSPDEFHRVFAELWRKSAETLKEQSESQFREFQELAARWTETPVRPGL